MKKGIAKMGNRISAWLLTMAMVVGLVAVPAGEVKAETVNLGSVGKTSSNVTVKCDLADEANVDDGYYQYTFTITNNSGSTINDWVIEATLNGAVSSTNAADFASWSDISVKDSGTTLYIYPTNKSATINNGENVTYSKIGYSGGAIQSATVYYSDKSNAFQEVLGNVSGGGSQGDTTTDKGLNIEYNYAKLLQESLYFYDANMCGPNVGETSALSWRDDCHTMDMTAKYNGQTVDVSGGFHDAGDHVKFGLPQGYSAAVLGLGYYQFKDAYDELGQTEHFKTILDYFCDYFVNCSIYTDNANKSGTVQAFCYQVGDGTDGVGWSDHGYWGAPEDQEKGGSDYNRANMTLFTDDSMTATDIVSISACALALHAYNFPESSKSTQYLQTAKDLFTYATNHEKTVYVVDQYKSDSWEDDYCSAAAALYLVTKDNQYLQVLNQYKNSMNTGWVLCWNKTWGIVAVLTEDWNAASSIASCTGNVGYTPQGFLVIDNWGSARYNTTSQLLGLIYDDANGKLTMEGGSFSSWATGQMKYLLGNNNDKRCFVVGYNENSSQYPHHRAASRSGDAGQTNPDHYTLLGALVGGPDGNDSYSDNQGSFRDNEVAIDYNAGFVGAAAGLYLLHKNDTDAKNTLATDEELSAVGVTDKYFGSGSGSGGSGSGGSGGSGSGGSGSGGSGLGGSGSGGSGSGGSGSGSGNEGGGNGSTDNTKIQATSLTLTASVKGAKNIPVGNTIKLAPKKKITLQVAEFLPEGAESEGVTFTSSKPAVAKVDSNGKITAGKKAGKTTITVTTASGGASKTITVQVMKKAVSKVTIKTSKTTIQVKKNVKLKVTITPNKKNASNNVFWKSSNTKVATVSSKGVVKGVKKGKAKITAVATDGSGKKATVTIQVK